MFLSKQVTYQGFFKYAEPGESQLGDPQMKRLEQKKFCYTFSPLNKPVIRISPGETVITSVPDYLEGRIKSDGERLPAPLVEMQYNAIAGPIYVEEAERGDTLSVNIVDIMIDTKEGVESLFSPLDDLTFALMKPFDYKFKICRIESGTVRFRNGITVPMAPNLGCIGTAPMFESIASGSMFTSDAGRHGGNLDVVEICKGATVQLPVFVKGALLGVGDIHAYLPPTGEITAVDAAGTVTFTVDLVKGKAINWPRIESDDYLMTVNNKSPMEKAVQTGIAEMILWLGEFGIDAWEAWERIGEVGESKISKISSGVAPVITTKFPKRYLGKP